MARAARGGNGAAGTGGAAKPPDAAGRAAAPRHPYGPRPVAALVPGATRAAFRRRSPAGALLMADWALVVGPELAARTVPRRLSGGTLVVACSGPVALELQHLAAALLGRINAHCGQAVVQRLRFVQEGMPTPPPRPPPAPLGPAPALPGLPQGELREALALLGQRVAGRRM